MNRCCELAGGEARLIDDLSISVGTVGGPYILPTAQTSFGLLTAHCAHCSDLHRQAAHFQNTQHNANLQHMECMYMLTAVQQHARQLFNAHSQHTQAGR